MHQLFNKMTDIAECKNLSLHDKIFPFNYVHTVNLMLEHFISINPLTASRMFYGILSKLFFP